ncbi:hypothetical protein ElyMa_003012600 [Elysia marginata]|uniref:Uncharacterized protein n=1 Tax=Elysia marginata TaxID=1093978 RepID=A0AAV4II64_9GAST|nr:hypothetical protein ElyMa_003012600 [Elysia marginata]
MKTTLTLDMQKYFCVPPETPSIASKSLCYFEEALLSIANLFANFKVQEPFWTTSVSEYDKDMALMPEYHENYLDYICSNCLSIHQNTVGFRDRLFLSGLRVLMSVSETPGYAVYDLPKDLRRHRQPVPWWSWTCRFSEQMNLEDPSSRWMLQYDTRFILT